MALIVQKFGGSSVADAERVFNVAKIVTDTYKKGNDVVVVVSAQGDTTDDLIAKQMEINPEANKRERDMLLASGEQISISLLAMACEKLGVNPEDFSHHRALDDSLMTVECIKKVYDSAKLQKYIRKCDAAFYKKLSFKPYVIKDLNDPDIDRSKLKCVCDTCGGKVVKKKKWGFVNNSFRAEFYCPNCDKNFRVSVRYKRYFDRVEAKKTFSDIVQKDRHRSKQKEKV